MAYKHAPSQRDMEMMRQVLPKRLPFAKWQIALLIASGACVVVTALAILLMWSHIDDIIPTHYGLSGRADGWGSKNMLWLLLLLDVGLYIMMVVCLFLPKFWDLPYRYTAENVIWAYSQLLGMMCIETFVLTVLLAGIIFVSMMAIENLSVFFLLIVIGVLAIPIIVCWQRLRSRAE